MKPKTNCMKKRLFLFMMFFSGILLSVNAQQKWGIRGGLNISTTAQEVKAGDGISFSDDGTNAKVGFRVGIVSLGNISKVCSFQPGLYLTQMGMRLKEDGVKEVDNMYYLQAPLLLSFNIPLGRSLTRKWQILCGPYVSCGIGGKMKITENGETMNVKLFKKLDVMGGEKKSILNRFDAGISFGTGYLAGKFFVGVNYDLGLVNIMNKDVNDEVKFWNRNFTLAIGVNF